ncbi:MAG: OsmC family protein [Sedimenticola sp.]|nr:OsmC family protein [Sedimenticola sp.]
MSEHKIDLDWKGAPPSSDQTTYNRNHTVSFSDTVQVTVSSAPEYKGDPNCADPEKLLTSALASCHMLTFLAIADLKGFRVESYKDQATGFLEKGESGRPHITRIELRPSIVFAGEEKPDEAAIKRMHASAHKNCFIANSIKAKVDVLDT